MGDATGEHDAKEKWGNGAPKAGEEIVGEYESDDNEEIEETENDFLKAGILEVGSVPRRKFHRNGSPKMDGTGNGSVTGNEEIAGGKLRAGGEGRERRRRTRRRQGNMLRLEIRIGGQGEGFPG